MPDTIKFVVLGCGKIGQEHIKAIQENPFSKLVAVCDNKAKYRHPSITHFDSLEKLLLSALDFDVMCICTPNGLHAKHSIEVLKHKKHIVIEKPMALTKKEGEQIVFEALQNAKHVFCVMQNRYTKAMQFLKKAVEDNLFGKVYLVQINCFWNRDERYYTSESWHGTTILDGGVLYTQFAHFIDLIHWLFGDIKNIQSHFKNYKHQTTTDFIDTGIVSFEFNSGGLGNMTFTTAVARKNFENIVNIITEKGTVQLKGQYMNEISYCDIEGLSNTLIKEENPKNHQKVIDNVVAVLQNKQTITTNALEGLKVVEIIEKIYRTS